MGALFGLIYIVNLMVTESRTPRIDNRIPCGKYYGADKFWNVPGPMSDHWWCALEA